MNSRSKCFEAILYATAILGAWFSIDASAEENWSRFRGPNGAGVAAGVSFPDAWTADDYAWKVSLPGKGHSSPVGWGNRLFVTMGDPETGELSLIALEAVSGRTIWTERFESPPHRMHGANSYASSTPAVDAERIYTTWAASSSLMIAALDHSGDEVWRRELGPLDYKHGFGGSPMVLGDLVVVANDNAGESFVTALDAKTGEPRWRRIRAGGTESYATPAVWRGGGAEQLIVHSTSEGMAGLSPADGAVLWQLPDVFPERCVNSPLVAGGLVFGGSGEGGNGKSFVAVRPAASPGDKPTVVYRLSKSLPQVPTPVAKDDLLFIWSDRGVVSCYDLATGEIHWSERVGGNYFGSPVAAGDKLYCTAADGEAVVLAAGKEYKLLGRTDLGDATSATPIIHGGKMYLRTETSLACLPSER